ncbi:MAG: hypothetical protein A2Y12_04910 [Planctomycetes bacterium GWF2_42_9]|nr:MAG: hypothetical protein A2Y12_04910 [Planctomycetes bacterium GWF2_42_9]
MSGKSGAIKAGAAYVEIFADKSPLVRGLKSAEKSIRAWGTSISSMGQKMMGIGAAITGPLIAAAKHAATYADNISDMAQMTGAGVEALQGLSYAADLNDVSMQSLGKSMVFMHKNMYELNKGTKSAVEAFGKLGLSAKDLKGKSPDEQFLLLADRIASVENPTDRAALALKVFGRAGSELLPLLNQGKGAIQAYRAEMQRLGAVMSSEDVNAAALFHEELKKLWWVIKNGLINAIGSAIIPMLRDWANRMTEMIGTVTRWIKANRGIVSMVLWLGVALVSAGAAFVVFGNALIWLSKVCAIVRGGFAILKTALMFMMSPLGLLIIQLSACAAALLYFTGYGGELMNWLGGCFNSLKEDAIAAFGGIANALKKGDLGLAARIGWLFVKTEWLKAKQWMLEIWYSVKLAIMEFWYAAVYGIVDAWNTAIYGIQVGWIETVAFVQRVWTNAGAILKGAWIDCVGFFKTLWVGFKQFFGDTVAWMAKKLMNIWIWWKKITDPTFDEKSARADIDSTFAAEDSERAATADADRLKIDKEQDAKRLQLETDTQNELDGIEKARSGKRGDAKTVYDSQIGASQQIVTDGLQGLIDSSNASMNKVADDLAATKDDFNSSIAKANEPVAPKVKPKLPNKDWETKNGLEKADSAGTFSAFRLGEMGVSSTLQSIAANTQRTADATEDMAENAGGNETTFGD